MAEQHFTSPSIAYPRRKFDGGTIVTAEKTVVVAFEAGGVVSIDPPPDNPGLAMGHEGCEGELAKTWQPTPVAVRSGVYGDRSFVFLRLFETRVETNVEAIVIIAATGFAAETWLLGGLIVASFAVGTGLHLGSHWLVAVMYGKGIDRMVLTRAGRIDYTGAPPRFFEEVLRTLAGPSMNAICAAAAYGVLAWIDVSNWHPVARQGVQAFAICNAILTAINFLPAIPFDGGLILHAVIRRYTGPARALRAAAWISLGLLAAMGALGVWLAQPILVYLAAAIAYDNWRKHLANGVRERSPQPEHTSSAG